MQPRISMITLGVRDLEVAIGFYEKGLGLPRMESPPEGHGFAGVALAHNVASEAEVDAVLAQAVAAGARLVKPGQKVFWGGYSGYFADLDGHLWEVAHNPHFWVGPPDRA